MRIIIVILVFLYPLSLKSEEMWHEKITIKVCEDILGWPPLILHNKEENLHYGYSFDVLNEILSKDNIKYKVDLLPWKRCKLYLKSGEMHLSLSGTIQQHDYLEDYYSSEPFYNLTPAVFYNKELFPEGPPEFADTEALFEKGKVCGVLGWGYDYNQKMADWGGDKLIRVQNFEAQVEMVVLKRCAYYLGYLEIAAGVGRMQGVDVFGNGKIGLTRFPESHELPGRFWVSKNFKYAKELITYINQGVQKMIYYNQLDPIARKYGFRVDIPKRNVEIYPLEQNE